MQDAVHIREALRREVGCGCAPKHLESLPSEALGIVGIDDPPLRTHTREDVLVLQLLRPQQLLLVVAHAALHTRDIVAERGNIIATATLPVIAVRRGAEAEVGHALPVARIVLGIAAGAGKVGDLIVLVARGLEALDEQLEEA